MKTIQILYQDSNKGSSINYVDSKLEISDPPSLSSFLLSRVYLVNRLWGYPPPPPYRDDIVYGQPPNNMAHFEANA